jgi:hypothetical protein
MIINCFLQCADKLFKQILLKYDMRGESVQLMCILVLHLFQSCYSYR